MSARSLASRAVLRRVKTSQLLLLLSLDERPSLRKAAADLGVSQPAATKLLQDLEDTLGVVLFQRHPRGLRANACGKVMIRHARVAATELEHARQELAALASGETGLVKIGAVQSAIPFLLARAVARLKRDQPNLLVSVLVDTSNVLLPALINGELDLLVARPWEIDPIELGYEQLIDEPLAVVARIGHPMTIAGPLTVRDLIDLPWALLPEGSPMRHVLTPLFREAGREGPANLVETSSMFMMMALLQETDTIAVLPQEVAEYLEARNVLTRLPVMLPPIMGAYGVITRHDRFLSEGSAAFLNNLRAVLAERPTSSLSQSS